MSDQDPQSPKRSSPDLTIKLEPQVRAVLQSRFDVDAVESLLQRMDATERTSFLETLVNTRQNPPMGDAQTRGESKRQEAWIPVGSSDPERQALLEKMWAPYWDLLPKGAVDDPGYPYPGRELARIRQASAKAKGADSKK
jgi:hypothetical protein